MNEEPRGRDPLISTGRGGAGNIVRELSRGPDDALAGVERGREIRDRSVDRVSAERMDLGVLAVAVPATGCPISC